MAIDRASLSKVVSDQIRGQILDGTLQPGERLVEDRLSVELGVSRVPVREALLGPVDGRAGAARAAARRHRHRQSRPSWSPSWSRCARSWKR